LGVYQDEAVQVAEGQAFAGGQALALGAPLALLGNGPGDVGPFGDEVVGRGDVDFKGFAMNAAFGSGAGMFSPARTIKGPGEGSVGIYWGHDILLGVG
jgi:hypothetical protein